MAIIGVDDGSLQAGALTIQVDWLGLRVGNCFVQSLHSSYEPSELSQWLFHDDIATVISLDISITGLV